MKRSQVMKEQAWVRSILKKHKIPILEDEEIEILDFGLHDYDNFGLALIMRINEPEYCSKWLILKPNQVCVSHHHEKKKETFFSHVGTVKLTLPDKEVLLKPGECYTLEPGVIHSFSSNDVAIIEEVSTHDENEDSYFVDNKIEREPKIIEDAHK